MKYTAPQNMTFLAIPSVTSLRVCMRDQLLVFLFLSLKKISASELRKERMLGCLQKGFLVNESFSLA